MKVWKSQKGFQRGHSRDSVSRQIDGVDVLRKTGGARACIPNLELIVGKNESLQRRERLCDQGNIVVPQKRIGEAQVSNIGQIEIQISLLNIVETIAIQSQRA